MVHRLPTLALVYCVILSIVSRCQADFIIDDFENQAVNSGVGTPLDYFSFGEQLSDRGVTNLLGATSGSNAAVYAIDFDQVGFGVGAAHQNLNVILNADNLVSVNLKFASGLQNGGFVAFRLTDADGTIFRTADANLFSASAAFQTFSQTVSEINSVDIIGSTAGLDLTQITSVGLLFLDRSFSGTSTVVFDDLRIIAVPEPNSLALLICTVSIAILCFRKKSARTD
ncbi:MAG: hypothetical protein U0930_05875 [Pirellulales bacterium]